MLYIGENAFEDTGVDPQKLPRTLKHIGSGAFLKSCQKDLYIGLKYGIETIGDKAFDCGTVYIPASVKNLGTLNNDRLILEEGIEYAAPNVFTDCNGFSIPRSLKELKVNRVLTFYENEIDDYYQYYQCQIDDDHLYYRRAWINELSEESEFVDAAYRELEAAKIPVRSRGWVDYKNGKCVVHLEDWTSIRPYMDVKKILKDEKHVTVYFHTIPTWEALIYAIHFNSRIFTSVLGCSGFYILVPRKPKYDINHRLETNGSNDITLKINSKITKDEIAYIAELYAVKIKDIKIGDGMKNLLYRDGVLYDTEDKCVLLSTSSGDVHIMDGMQRICRFAFRNVESVHLPDSIISIGDHAFFRSNIQRINIPDGVRFIADSAFAYCQNLKDVVLPQSLEQIGKKAFYGCWSLTHINIPPKVWIINEYTFSRCDNMKTVELTEGLNCICNYAFELTALSEVALPTTVIKVEAKAFAGTAYDRR